LKRLNPILQSKNGIKTCKIRSVPKSLKEGISVKILIVEDDFVTRRLLQSFLSPYGTSDITVNGLEAINAFKMALDEKIPYNLI
jgi:hypothetical protein